MTILPTKRSTKNNHTHNDETNEKNNQNNAKDRNSKHRDERNSTAGDPGVGRERFQLERRESERQKQRELRRQRKAEYQTKRVNTSDNAENIVISTDKAADNESSNIDVGGNGPVRPEEDGSGCNSEDEYNARRPSTDSLPTDEEWARRDVYFSKCLIKLGFDIKKMPEDGACLFRAIADQIYGDQELHTTIRTLCMDYIVKNKDFFAPYVTEDFDKYIQRKRKWHVHGNHLEIQAISEMYNRTIEVYAYHTEPIKIFNASRRNSFEPIRVSYHRKCHYNSIVNPNKTAVFLGFGLPDYRTRCDVDEGMEVHDAVSKSEQLLIEQAMLEDKIKATDWEATNEALEEQVARESYIQYYRDVERRLKIKNHCTASGSSSTATSNMYSSPRSRESPKGSTSPKGSSPTTLSPQGLSSRMCPCISEGPLSYSHKSEMVTTYDTTNSNTRYPSYGMDGKNANEKVDETLMPKSSTITSVGDDSILQQEGKYADWDETVMAQVLAESQLTYFDDLKRQVKQNGSPESPTSH